MSRSTNFSSLGSNANVGTTAKFRKGSNYINYNDFSNANQADVNSVSYSNFAKNQTGTPNVNAANKYFDVEKKLESNVKLVSSDTTINSEETSNWQKKILEVAQKATGTIVAVTTSVTEGVVDSINGIFTTGAKIGEYQMMGAQQEIEKNLMEQEALGQISTEERNQQQAKYSQAYSESREEMHEYAATGAQRGEDFKSKYIFNVTIPGTNATVKEYIINYSVIQEDTFLWNVGSSIGQMVPVIVSNTLIPGSGTAVFASSCFGNSLSQAYAEGADDEEAVTYALLSTAVEVAVELIPGNGFGGVSKFGKIADSSIYKAIKKVANNETVKKVMSSYLAQFTFNAVSEGMEEVVSDIMAPFILKMSYLKEEDLTDIITQEYTVENFATDFALGAVSSAGLQGISTISGAASSIAKGTKANTTLYEETYQNIPDDVKKIIEKTDQRLQEDLEDSSKFNKEKLDETLNKMQYKKDVEQRLSKDVVTEANEKQLAIENNDLYKIEKFNHIEELNKKIDSSLEQINWTRKKLLDVNKTKNISQEEVQIAQSIYDKAAKSEPAVTSDLKQFETEESCLIGLDYRLKQVDSLSRKIHDEGIGEINDSLRYTFISEDANYSNTVVTTLEGLIEKGYTIDTYKSKWGNPAYQGINMTLVTPDGSQVFELQFHTETSFKTKEFFTHKYFEIVRGYKNYEGPAVIKKHLNNIVDYSNDIQLDFQKMNTISGVDISTFFTSEWLGEKINKHMQENNTTCKINNVDMVHGDIGFNMDVSSPMPNFSSDFKHKSTSPALNAIAEKLLQRNKQQSFFVQNGELFAKSDFQVDFTDIEDVYVNKKGFYYGWTKFGITPIRNFEGDPLVPMDNIHFRNVNAKDTSLYRVTPNGILQIAIPKSTPNGILQMEGLSFVQAKGTYRDIQTGIEYYVNPADGALYQLGKNTPTRVPVISPFSTVFMDACYNANPEFGKIVKQVRSIHPSFSMRVTEKSGYCHSGVSKGGYVNISHNTERLKIKETVFHEWGHALLGVCSKNYLNKVNDFYGALIEYNKQPKIQVETMRNLDRKVYQGCMQQAKSQLDSMKVTYDRDTLCTLTDALFRETGLGGIEDIYELSTGNTIRYGHGSQYYNQISYENNGVEGHVNGTEYNKARSRLEECFANYTSARLSYNTDALNLIKQIIGPQAYQIIESTYNNAINSDFTNMYYDHIRLTNATDILALKSYCEAYGIGAMEQIYNAVGLDKMKIGFNHYFQTGSLDYLPDINDSHYLINLVSSQWMKDYYFDNINHFEVRDIASRQKSNRITTKLPGRTTTKLPGRTTTRLPGR